MKKLRTISIIVLALCLGLFAVNTASAIEEDEPGWDCHTMGNMVCGTTTYTFENPDGWAPDVSEPDYCTNAGGVWDYDNSACLLTDSAPYTTDKVDYTPDVVVEIIPSFTG